MFGNFLGVLEAIARLGDKATIGEVQKINNHLTRGQTERLMNTLVKEGYAGFDVVPYGSTGKKLWYCTSRCNTNMSIVTTAIERGVYTGKASV